VPTRSDITVFFSTTLLLLSMRPFMISKLSGGLYSASLLGLPAEPDVEIEV
jgi:hypothetical protein